MIIDYKYDELPTKLLQNPDDSTIDKKLLDRWKFLHDNTNVFRYKLNLNKQKILDGKYGFILQLNTDRCIKRRPPIDIKTISQSFDPKLFNFNKISPDEIILQLRNTNEDAAKHVIIINDSPINFGHSLFCPYVDECLPQVINFNSLILMSHFMFLCSDRNIRVGFNSLCGFASVNHLHYHILSIDGQLPVEKARCKHLIGNLYCTEGDYPAPAYSFQITVKQDIENICRDVDKLITLFIKLNVAHNVCFTRKYCNSIGEDVLRIYVWARENCHGAKELFDVNVAICELSGYFPIYSQQSFENINDEEACSILRRWSDASYHKILPNVMELYSSI